MMHNYRAVKNEEVHHPHFQLLEILSKVFTKGIAFDLHIHGVSRSTNSAR
jgi:hypothetical protein